MKSFPILKSKRGNRRLNLSIQSILALISLGTYPWHASAQTDRPPPQTNEINRQTRALDAELFAIDAQTTYIDALGVSSDSRWESVMARLARAGDRFNHNRERFQNLRNRLTLARIRLRHLNESLQNDPHGPTSMLAASELRAISNEVRDLRGLLSDITGHRIDAAENADFGMFAAASVGSAACVLEAGALAAATQNAARLVAAVESSILVHLGALAGIESVEAVRESRTNENNATQNLSSPNPNSGPSPAPQAPREATLHPAPQAQNQVPPQTQRETQAQQDARRRERAMIESIFRELEAPRPRPRPEPRTRVATPEVAGAEVSRFLERWARANAQPGQSGAPGNSLPQSQSNGADGAPGDWLLVQLAADQARAARGNARNNIPSPTLIRTRTDQWLYQMAEAYMDSMGSTSTAERLSDIQRILSNSRFWLRQSAQNASTGLIAALDGAPSDSRTRLAMLTATLTAAGHEIVPPGQRLAIEVPQNGGEPRLLTVSRVDGSNPRDALTGERVQARPEDLRHPAWLAYDYLARWQAELTQNQERMGRQNPRNRSATAPIIQIPVSEAQLTLFLPSPDPSRELTQNTNRPGREGGLAQESGQSGQSRTRNRNSDGNNSNSDQFDDIRLPDQPLLTDRVANDEDFNEQRLARERLLRERTERFTGPRATTRTLSELATFGNSGLERWARGEPLGFDFMEYLIELYAADPSNSPSMTQMEYDQLRSQWQNNIQELRALIATNRDPEAQIRLVSEYLISHYLRSYYRDDASPISALRGAGTNCQGQTLMITAALEALRIHVPPNLNIGIQDQSHRQHIRPILYHQAINRVTDLVSGDNETGRDGDLFSPAFALWGVLNTLTGQRTRLGIASFSGPSVSRQSLLIMPSQHDPDSRDELAQDQSAEDDQADATTHLNIQHNQNWGRTSFSNADQRRQREIERRVPEFADIRTPRWSNQSHSFRSHSQGGPQAAQNGSNREREAPNSPINSNENFDPLAASLSPGMRVILNEITNNVTEVLNGYGDDQTRTAIRHRVAQTFIQTITPSLSRAEFDQRTAEILTQNMRQALMNDNYADVLALITRPRELTRIFSGPNSNHEFLRLSEALQTYSRFVSICHEMAVRLRWWYSWYGNSFNADYSPLDHDEQVAQQQRCLRTPEVQEFVSQIDGFINRLSRSELAIPYLMAQTNFVEDTRRAILYSTGLGLGERNELESNPAPAQGRDIEPTDLHSPAMHAFRMRRLLATLANPNRVRLLNIGQSPPPLGGAPQAEQVPQSPSPTPLAAEALTEQDVEFIFAPPGSLHIPQSQPQQQHRSPQNRGAPRRINMPIDRVTILLNDLGVQTATMPLLRRWTRFFEDQNLNILTPHCQSVYREAYRHVSFDEDMRNFAQQQRCHRVAIYFVTSNARSLIQTGSLAPRGASHGVVSPTGFRISDYWMRQYLLYFGQINRSANFYRQANPSSPFHELSPVRPFSRNCSNTMPTADCHAQLRQDAELIWPWLNAQADRLHLPRIPRMPPELYDGTSN